MSRHSGQKIDILNNKIIFNKWRKQCQSKQKKAKVCYIGVQNFVHLPATCHTHILCHCISLNCGSLLDLELSHQGHAKFFL